MTVGKQRRASAVSQVSQIFGVTPPNRTIESYRDSGVGDSIAFKGKMYKLSEFQNSVNEATKSLYKLTFTKEPWFTEYGADWDFFQRFLDKR